MDDRAEKIIGYVLLGAGLVLILLAVNSAYTVFTGAGNPPALFKMDSIVINVNNPSGGTNSVELLSGAIASRFADMVSWYILMFFLLQAGAAIAGLGIKLVKEIRLTVKSRDGQ